MEKEIVINNCYGGFGLTKEVYRELGIKWDGYGYIGNTDLDIKSENYMAYREDKRLIKVIKKVGLEKSSGGCAELRIVKIPNNIEYTIEEYDGIEHIAEKHRTW